MVGENITASKLQEVCNVPGDIIECVAENSTPSGSYAGRFVFPWLHPGLLLFDPFGVLISNPVSRDGRLNES